MLAISHLQYLFVQEIVFSAIDVAATSKSCRGKSRRYVRTINIFYSNINFKFMTFLHIQIAHEFLCSHNIHIG